MSEFGAILSPEEHEKWVNDLIIPTFTLGREPSQNPTFVLITGQPGAGKSYSSHRYAQEYVEGAPVIFGADDIRALHPQAEEILRTDRANYPFITKKDAGLARKKLLDYCFDKKLNIVVESVLLDKDDYKMQTLLDAKKHGYRIECVALGVHRFVSEVSIYHRQESQLAVTKEIGFPATLNAHDTAYSLLPNILADMNDYGTVDKISIYDRQYRCFYDSDKNPHDPVLIRQRMRDARMSYLNKNDMTDVALKWQEVIRMMKERDASSKEIEEAQELFVKFLKNSGLALSPEYRKYSSLNDTQNI